MPTERPSDDDLATLPRVDMTPPGYWNNSQFDSPAMCADDPAYTKDDDLSLASGATVATSTADFLSQTEAIDVTSFVETDSLPVPSVLNTPECAYLDGYLDGDGCESESSALTDDEEITNVSKRSLKKRQNRLKLGEVEGFSSICGAKSKVSTNFGRLYNNND